MKESIDIEGDTLLNEVGKEDLIKVLLLLETNNHLSASKLGLEERRDNRHKAIKILSDILEMDEKELEELYYQYLTNV